MRLLDYRSWRNVYFEVRFLNSYGTRHAISTRFSSTRKTLFSIFDYTSDIYCTFIDGKQFKYSLYKLFNILLRSGW